ncbi:Aryl hydrocarbon receptor [Camelus dromedarius]|uniref:Aryl hydrocarbon receptor n=1 Tax=Camelus dromedarius TaxID=9838 RepID=A0A5N4DY89_CAMDR|nr:aryl hydrocarbon receptor isoform X2 [Camelus dromedarius]KAB1276059.1 Aryl hydrocarbon receptor [Camelus dromedarius]
MNSSSANITYASRKRRKPVQKTVKPIPAEGIKSNPSKRHRDRLNTELDRLASLLPFPQDVINKLDKLSVLRLSVSYLRAKSFFDVALKSSPADRNGVQDNCRTKFRDSLNLQEGEFLLQALNGFVLVVTTDALVFYASSTIQDYLGFQQSDVIHQSVYELIHTEDRAEFQRQLHWALNPSQCPDSGQRIDEANGLPQPGGYYDPDQLPPENSLMERCFICRLRCLLDNSSGFLAMNFQGRLKYLHGQNKKGKDGSVLPPQLALFAIATPLQPPSILEIRNKNFIFRTKHKLDFTPTGCDAKGKIVLGYTEAELRMRGSGYQFVHAADMLYCAEYHIRMIKTGESGMVVFRLLTKDNRWAWVQSNARLVYKNGRPDYIIATQRPLTDEEGTEHLQKRNMQLPFLFTTGEAVLYEISNPFPPMMDPLPIRTKHGASGKESATQSTLSKDSLNPSSLLSAMMQQDESIYLCPASSSTSFKRNFFNQSVNECSNWQNSVAPVGSDNLLKHEPVGQSQEMNLSLSVDHAGLFPDNRNSDLYSIMQRLGIDFEDIKHMQENEFFQTDFSEENDFGDDIDLTDEILTYVEDSLNKPTFGCSSFHQPQPVALNASCMVQEQLQLEQQLQRQQKLTAVEPQQLCQKMKHMQVNGMFANWNSDQSVPFTCPQQDLQQYDIFSDLPGTSQDFPYKSEMDTMPYTQNFIPCNQSVLPPHSKGTQLDFPMGNFEPTPYPTATSNLEDFLTCLQVPENQKHGLNPQSAVVTPQTCYAGAVSMYQCQPEPQHSHVAPMQYDPSLPGPEAFLNKFQNGGVLNETSPAQLPSINNTQTATHLHPSEARPFPDWTSSGFL